MSNLLRTRRAILAPLLVLVLAHGGTPNQVLVPPGFSDVLVASDATGETVNRARRTARSRRAGPAWPHSTRRTGAIGPTGPSRGCRPHLSSRSVRELHVDVEDTAVPGAGDGLEALSGDDGADVGVDNETPVTEDYAELNNRFTGRIYKVTVAVTPRKQFARRSLSGGRAPGRRRRSLALMEVDSA